MYNILLKSSYVDIKNKFMVGWSRGGLTSYLLLKNGLSFNATVVLTSVPDLEMDANHDAAMEQGYKLLMPNYKKNKKKLLYERSAVNWPEKHFAVDLCADVIRQFPSFSFSDLRAMPLPLFFQWIHAARAAEARANKIDYRHHQLTDFVNLRAQVEFNRMKNTAQVSTVPIP